MDVDEWGQIAIINMLTRYARTQFRDPNTSSVLSCKYADLLLVIPLFLKVYFLSFVTKTITAPDSYHSKSNPPSDNGARLEVSRSVDKNVADEEVETKDATGDDGALDPALEELWRSDYRLLIVACRLLLFSHNAAVCCILKSSCA